MTKIKILFLAIFVLITAVAATSLVACEFRDDYCKTPEPKVIIHNNIEKTEDLEKDIYEVSENELPPESFVGTIIEESTSHMVVVPGTDEKEYDISKRIRVEYIHDHIDYLYGIGRKVVITYIPPFDNNTIVTDDIRHDGFENFKLSVQYKSSSLPVLSSVNYSGTYITHVANNTDFIKDGSDYNLYYLGLYDVYVTVDGNTLPLKEALFYGKVTLDGIIAECNRLKSIGEIKGEEYKDGGSILYDFGDFKIIKYHTLDGYRDIYIGTSDMGIEAHNSRSLCIGGYKWIDLGVRLSVKDVSCDGATLVFKQRGGNVTGTLQTGEAFYLERLDGNKWISVSTKPLIDYAFHMVAYNLNENGETEFLTEWKWLYDSLPEGRYRIAKKVMDFREAGDFDEQVYYAYFEI